MPSLVRDAAGALPTMNRTKTSAPAVQAAGSPPKEVRFPSDKQLVTTSRERTEREAWSFYWFETHCKECPHCHDPYSVYKRGEHLCSKGEALARDMSLLVYMRDGEVYERLDDPRGSPDRVEIPHNYQHLMGELKAMEKTAKHHRRRSHRPIVQHDQGPGRCVDERKREDRYYQDRIIREEKPSRSEKKYEKPHRSDRREVIVEPPRSADADRDNKETTGRRRQSHSADYRRDEGESRREQMYVREERPQRDGDYKKDERKSKERRYNKNETDVKIESSRREKQYRTEIRKPEKEYRRSYYH